MSTETGTRMQRDGETASLAFEPYPDIPEEGGLPDQTGLYPSGKRYQELVTSQSGSEVDARPYPSPQELANAHEVALAADTLETERAQKIGAFASVGTAYTHGHVSPSVFGAAQQEIATSVAGLDKKLGATYRAAERKVRQVSAREDQVRRGIEALRNRR